MSEVLPVAGKVIRILNDREVVLNKGATSGLQEGDYIGIIDPATENLQDPDTGEDLGGIRRYKVALRVSRVSERAAIAATYKTRSVNLGGTGGPTASISKLFAEPKYVSQIEKLRLSETGSRPLGPSESRVQQGDDFESIDKETAESGFTLVQF